MNFSISTIFDAVNFSSITNFTNIIERIDADVTRLGNSATRLYSAYHEGHLGPQSWTEWIIDWVLWVVLHGVFRVGIMLWTERDAVLMHSHLILAALFPIYIGSHASLRRPPSAAAPKNSDTQNEDDDEINVEPTVEGLTPSDAIMFPVLAGITLGGLYFLIKWMKDPALLNRILGWYFSALGVFGVGKLAADALNVGTTFLFPSVWSSKMRTYYVDPLLSRQTIGQVSGARTLVHREVVDGITNPLPGRFLSAKKFSQSTTKKLWALRSLLKNHWIFRGYLHNVFSITSKIQIQDITGFIFGIAAITLYNTWGKVWFLTNLIGFGFCYGTLQLMSPTTFWTGSLVLAGLFIYDITMVFYTPLMVTVATTLDVPIKLVFPGVAGKRGSILGLGDIVLPGIMMALALRFDLYLHYLRKQTTLENATKVNNPTESTVTALSHTISTVNKAEYIDATGKWGERFWTWGGDLSNKTAADGSRFKKVYFWASVVGYLTGMITTLAVLKIYNHAQPALLYLVPGVLIALWGTALVRREFALMWGYTEDGSLDDVKDESKHSDAESIAEPKKESQADIKDRSDAYRRMDNNISDLSPFQSSDDGSDNEASNRSSQVVLNGRKGEKEESKEVAHAQHVFLFSLSTPKQQTGVPRKANLFDRS